MAYRIHTDGIGEQTVDVHFDDCEHDDYEYEGRDPDVGILTEYAWCLDCGAEATEWDVDVDVNEDGMPYLSGSGSPIWKAPTYLDEDED